MTDAPARVTIILVNWNGLSDTRECLASLSAVTYPAASVLVVDNGSGGDEAGALRGEFPWAEVVATGSNLGFTGGNNVGIVRALSSGAEYVLCLNNDTAVAPDFLGPLVQALEDDPQAGMAASKIFYHGAPDETWYLGAECTFDRAALRRTIPAWHPPYPERRALTAPFETQIATGCALLVRGDLMRRLGGFDDRYFAYFEDVDLSLRAASLGWRCLVVPASRVWHKVSRSSGGQDAPNVAYYTLRNTALLASAHAGGPRSLGAAFYRVFARLWLKEADLLLEERPVSARNRARAQAIVSGVWCARLGRYGRRQDHPWVERFAAWWVALASARPRNERLGRLVHQLTRPYWYLNAHVFRRLRRVEDQFL